jgi:hypothetical protein
MFDLWKCLRREIFGMFALFIIVASSFGQSGTGGVRGQVTDSSGAAVPAIAVTAVAPNGASHQVQTNEEGRYVFQDLAPGTYTLRIQVKGFADFKKADVVVTASQVQVVDAQLVVARNVFNVVNLGTPIGQLSSPLFGKSNSLAGGFGPGGGNRHIDFQVMFSF